MKGEATYGEPRIVPIREEIRPVIARYLAARAKWVIEHDCPSKALFPSGDERSGDGFMCGNSLRRMKDIVEDELHIRFDLRECRRTFGQRYLDSDLEISSVSVLMGHATTKTTERFYGRQKNRMAIEKARATWTSKSEEQSMTGKGSENTSQQRWWTKNHLLLPQRPPFPWWTTSHLRQNQMVDNPRKLVDKHLELAEFERIGNLDIWLEKKSGQGESRHRVSQSSSEKAELFRISICSITCRSAHFRRILLFCPTNGGQVCC